MRFEMWKSKAQKGAFLVFTALMIPIIFLCAGFAVDLGNAWAYKSKLQNAADAAVLAGAYQYQADDKNKVDSAESKKNVEGRIDRYMNANNGGIPFSRDKKDDSKNGIFYRFPKEGSTAKGLLLTLHVSEEAPTTFSKMFGFGNLHVAVVSTARILPSSGGGGGSSDVFSYAMIGAAMSNSDIMKKINRWSPYSIDIEGQDTYIDGKIYAGDTVKVNGKENTNVIENSNFSTSSTDDERLWPFGNQEWDNETQKMYTLKWRLHTPDGKDIKADGHYVDPIDISYSSSNPNTENIYNFVEEQKSKYHAVGNTLVDRGNDIYMDFRRPTGHTWEIAGFDSSSHSDAYPIIITNGDIRIENSFYAKNTSLMKEHNIIVISLNGNIVIEGGGPQTNVHDSFRGLLYAPNGYISYHYDGNDFEGSMVAQQIQLYSTGKRIKWNRFDFPGGSSGTGHGSGSGTGTAGGSGEISLYADIDDSYEPAN